MTFFHARGKVRPRQPQPLLTVPDAEFYNQDQGRETRLNEPAYIFGAALDYLDDPDRIGLKLAYLNALAEGRLEPELPADPYEAIAPQLAARTNGVARLAGRIEVPGWLTPRPGPQERERIDPKKYQEFMAGGGVEEYIARCRQRAREILPRVPVLIAVDHALAAGPIRAAAERFGPEAVAVVVLDGHFDAVPAELRAASAEHVLPEGPAAAAAAELPVEDFGGFDPRAGLGAPELGALGFEAPVKERPGEAGPSSRGAGSGDEVVFPDSPGDEPDDLVYSPERFSAEEDEVPTGYLAGVPYGFMSSKRSLRGEWLCGDFLAGLMEEGTVRPENLYVVGVSDYPSPSAAELPYGKAYWSWIERGVKVYPKKRALAPNFGRLLMAELDRSPARMLYVSLDADVGALTSMMAARFMDRVGLPEERIMGVAQGLRELLEWERFRLAGLDISEIEVHFLGLEGPQGADHTARVCAQFAATILGNMTLTTI